MWQTYTNSDNSMDSEKNKGNRVVIRDQLADAAKTDNWQKVFEVLNKYPDLINSTRPRGESLYTPLHQAAHGNAPLEVIQQMLDLGASLTIKIIADERPVDIAKRKGYQHLIQLLNPDQEKSDQV
jgi:ankyrin repeat protein